MRLHNLVFFLFFAAAMIISFGCSKLVSIGEPADKITSKKLFSTEAGATGALAGVYSTIINGRDGNATGDGCFALFGGGESTYLGALSSDELLTPVGLPFFSYNSNHIVSGETMYSDNCWNSAYAVIYGANAVIEGVAASSGLRDSVRSRLTGEARFIRAFSYFYLVNFFGDVPMPLTSNVKETKHLSRASKQAVYEQIIKDLQEAQTAIPDGYSIETGKRILASRWAATALLARVYLYTGRYNDAATQATALINKKEAYDLETDLNRVFLTSSKEAIWQLMQNVNHFASGNSTPEGYLFVPTQPDDWPINSYLTPSLLEAFEPGDKRKEMWTGSTEYSYTPGTPTRRWYPYKYKTGPPNLVVGGTPTEYLMALRLAEQYLIRAEASANQSGGLIQAITDLNIIRQRAGLTPLPNNLSKDEVLAAIAQEWRIEYFCEWGHRWFNLKRTNKAHDVLSVLSYKKPWAGDYQLLYPIPANDTLYNNALRQNPGY